MSFFTLNEIRQAATTITGAAYSDQGARDVLTKEAVRGSVFAVSFDIFLSHSFQDGKTILGLKRILERGGQRVYVDWIDDPDLDRNRVTAATAERLRSRMRASAALIFATSTASSTSKWMPWELGYFDGFRGERIAVLPLVDYAGQGFVGQEYLGLYPTVSKEGIGGSQIMVTRGSGVREGVRLNEFSARTGSPQYKRVN